MPPARAGGMTGGIGRQISGMDPKRRYKEQLLTILNIVSWAGPSDTVSRGVPEQAAELMTSKLILELEERWTSLPPTDQQRKFMEKSEIVENSASQAESLPHHYSCIALTCNVSGP